MSKIKLFVALGLLAMGFDLMAAGSVYKGLVQNDDLRTVGSINVTVGAANKKTGISSLSIVLELGSKKYKTSGKGDFSDGSVQFTWKGLGAVDLQFADGGVEGSLGESLTVEPYEAGDVESWLDGEFSFSLDGEPEFDGNGELLSEYLPDGEPIYATKGKWKTDKAYAPKIVKIDGEKTIDVKGDTNHAALSLSYNKKKGTVSGSFKVYVATYNKNGDYAGIKTYAYKLKGEVSGSSVIGIATNKQLGDLSFTID